MTSYKRFSLFAFFLVVLGSLLWFFHCAFVRETDHQRYKAYKLKQHEINSSTKMVSENTYQTREGVRKDIWTAESDGTRLQYRIESKSSLLRLTPGENKMEIIENLHGIRCWMQDKLLVDTALNTPLQNVRYFEADQGTYRYNSQNFEARTVSLFLMRLQGHALAFNSGPKDAFLRGIAQNVSFCINEGMPQFQAKNFKASIKGSDL